MWAALMNWMQQSSKSWVKQSNVFLKEEINEICNFSMFCITLSDLLLWIEMEKI